MTAAADDDERWADALGGRGADDSPTAREASVLRAAMLARTPIDADVPSNDPMRERALIERARRDGVVGAPRQRPVWQPLAAAAVLLLAVGVWFVGRSNEEAFVVRSAVDGTVRIETNDPAELKRALLKDLRAAGIAAHGYERLGTEGIDADLPRELDDAQMSVLERYQLVLPDDRVLRLEIVGPAE